MSTSLLLPLPFSLSLFLLPRHENERRTVRLLRCIGLISRVKLLQRLPPVDAEVTWRCWCWCWPGSSGGLYRGKTRPPGQQSQPRTWTWRSGSGNNGKGAGAETSFAAASAASALGTAGAIVLADAGIGVGARDKEAARTANKSLVGGGGLGATPILEELGVSSETEAWRALTEEGEALAKERRTVDAAVA